MDCKDSVLARRTVIRFAGSALAVTGISGITQARGSGKNHKKDFKATFDSETVRVVSHGENRSTVYLLGEAKGPQIGNGTVKHKHTAITDGDRRFVDGWYEVTAENEDKLRGTYQGDTKDSTPAEHKQATGSWTHTGGTGRFDGLEGEGRLNGTADLTSGSMILRLAGTMNT